MVDQYRHNDYQLPNIKKQLIDKDQILSFIKDGNKSAVYPRDTQLIFLSNSNFEERYNEKLKLMQNISVLLFGCRFKGLVAPFFIWKPLILIVSVFCNTPYTPNTPFVKLIFCSLFPWSSFIHPKKPFIKLNWEFVTKLVITFLFWLKYQVSWLFFVTLLDPWKFLHYKPSKSGRKKWFL